MTTIGQSTRISADRIWAAYHHNLITTVAGSLDPATQTVSLAAHARGADFGNPDSAIAANYVFETGNVLPAWNPATAPPEGLLYAYAAFLDNIELAGDIEPSLRAKIDTARSSYRVANKNFADVRSQAVSAWIEFRQAEPGIGFNSFVKAHFPLYTLAGHALCGADSEFEALMFQAYGSGYSEIADARSKCGITAGAAAIGHSNQYNMPVKRCVSSIETSCGILSATIPPPPGEPIPTYAPTFKLDGFDAAFSEWRSNSSRGIVSETIRITGESAGGFWSEHPWPPGGGKLNGDFFKVGNAGAYPFDIQPVNTRSADFSVSLAFSGLDTFNIAPGTWYDRKIVETYKNSIPPTMPRFFGEGGPIALLPTAVIVGYEPSIEVTLERSDYRRFKNLSQSSLADYIKVGPFTFAVEPGSAFPGKTGVNYNDARSSITVHPPKRSMPLLLGVVSTKQ